MNANKIINYSEVSEVLTGNRFTVRSTRNSPTFSEPVKELVDFVEGWVARNSKSNKAVLTIKTINQDA
jgi:hypothetical protein